MNLGAMSGQTRLERPGDELEQITIRGKRNKAHAIEFYAPRLDPAES